MDEIIRQEAAQILEIFQKLELDAKLYLVDDPFKIDLLFNDVVDAINTCTVLKTKLPYIEFVLPSREIANEDAGWIGHFEDRDNKRFFLSDVYDFLTLFIKP